MVERLMEPWHPLINLDVQCQGFLARAGCDGKYCNPVIGSSICRDFCRERIEPLEAVELADGLEGVKLPEGVTNYFEGIERRIKMGGWKDVPVLRYARSLGQENTMRGLLEGIGAVRSLVDAIRQQSLPSGDAGRDLACQAMVGFQAMTLLSESWNSLVSRCNHGPSILKNYDRLIGNWSREVGRATDADSVGECARKKLEAMKGDLNRLFDHPISMFKDMKMQYGGLAVNDRYLHDWLCVEAWRQSVSDAVHHVLNLIQVAGHRPIPQMEIGEAWTTLRANLAGRHLFHVF